MTNSRYYHVFICMYHLCSIQTVGASCLVLADPNSTWWLLALRFFQSSRNCSTGQPVALVQICSSTLQHGWKVKLENWSFWFCLFQERTFLFPEVIAPANAATRVFWMSMRAGKSLRLTMLNLTINIFEILSTGFGVLEYCISQLQATNVLKYVMIFAWRNVKYRCYWGYF